MTDTAAGTAAPEPRQVCVEDRVRFVRLVPGNALFCHPSPPTRSPPSLPGTHGVRGMHPAPVYGTGLGCSVQWLVVLLAAVAAAAPPASVTSSAELARALRNAAISEITLPAPQQVRSGAKPIPLTLQYAAQGRCQCRAWVVLSGTGGCCPPAVPRSLSAPRARETLPPPSHSPLWTGPAAWSSAAAGAWWCEVRPGALLPAGPGALPPAGPAAGARHAALTAPWGWRARAAPNSQQPKTIDFNKLTGAITVASNASLTWENVVWARARCHLPLCTVPDIVWWTPGGAAHTMKKALAMQVKGLKVVAVTQRNLFFIRRAGANVGLCAVR